MLRPVKHSPFTGAAVSQRFSGVGVGPGGGAGGGAGGGVGGGGGSGVPIGTQVTPYNAISSHARYFALQSGSIVRAMAYETCKQPQPPCQKKLDQSPVRKQLDKSQATIDLLVDL